MSAYVSHIYRVLGQNSDKTHTYSSNFNSNRGPLQTVRPTADCLLLTPNSVGAPLDICTMTHGSSLDFDPAGSSVRVPTPVLIGGFLQSFSQGIILVQTNQYWETGYSNDSCWLRSYVALIVCLSLQVCVSAIRIS